MKALACGCNLKSANKKFMYSDYIWHKDNTANLLYGFLKEREDGDNS